MNIIQVKVHAHDQESGDTATVPIAVPDLADVRAVAEQLHREGAEYSGVHWGCRCSTILNYVKMQLNSKFLMDQERFAQKCVHFGVPLVSPLARAVFGSIRSSGKTG